MKGLSEMDNGYTRVRSPLSAGGQSGGAMCVWHNFLAGAVGISDHRDYLGI